MGTHGDHVNASNSIKEFVLSISDFDSLLGEQAYVKGRTENSDLGDLEVSNSSLHWSPC